MFTKNHLVEAGYEIGVKEPSVEDSQAQASANELEVTQMVRIDT